MNPSSLRRWTYLKHFWEGRPVGELRIVASIRKWTSVSVTLIDITIRNYRIKLDFGQPCL